MANDGATTDQVIELIRDIIANGGTPQQVADEIVQAFAHRQYIGARYVPILGRAGESSIEWDSSAPYEPLTIVLHEGNSFTSRQYVPAGIDISNTDYWASTGNYNAQIEQYRQEVQSVVGRVDDAETAVSNLTDQVNGFETRLTANEQTISTVQGDVTENTNDISQLRTEYNVTKSDVSTLQGDMTTVQATVETHTEQIATIQSGLQQVGGWFYGANALFIGDSWTNRNLASSSGYGVTDPFCDQFAKSMGMDMTVIGAGGTGYIKTRDTYGTFQQMLTEWVTQHSDEAANINHVFVEGGCNDSASDYDQIVEAVKSFAEYVASALPNAYLHFIPQVGNVNFVRGLPTTNENAWRKVNRAVIEAYRDLPNGSRADCLYATLYTFAFGESSLFNTDMIHPTQAGHDHLARYLVDVYNGRPARSFKLDDISKVQGVLYNSSSARITSWTPTSTAINNCSLYWDETKLTGNLQIICNPTATGGEFVQLFNPGFLMLKPNTLSYWPVNFYYVASSGGAAQTGIGAAFIPDNNTTSMVAGECSIRLDPNLPKTFGGEGSSYRMYFNVCADFGAV